MSQEELQAAWDKCLLRAWVDNRTISAVVYRFAEEAAPILYKLRDYVRIIRYIKTLNLKRCPFATEDEGYQVYLKADHPARAIVAEASPRMSNCLWNGADPQSVLANIEKFKWRNYKKTKARQTVLNARYRAHHTLKYIRARALDKKHDWKTVK